MNDKTEDQPDETEPSGTGTPAGVEQAAGESAAEPAAAAPEPATGKSGSGLAALALLVALAAAGGTGYLWYEQQSNQILEARVAELGRDLERRAGDLERLIDGVDELSRIDRDLDDDIRALTSRIDQDFDGLPERLAQVESTLDKVPGISQKSRSAWLRSEAEYFLRVANAQLNLAGNVAVSLRALELADDQAARPGGSRL